MDFRQITMLQKIKSGMAQFQANHPKFPLFLKAVSKDALVEGTVIEMKITTPEGERVLHECKTKAGRYCVV